MLPSSAFICSSNLFAGTKCTRISNQLELDNLFEVNRINAKWTLRMTYYKNWKITSALRCTMNNTMENYIQEKKICFFYKSFSICILQFQFECNTNHCCASNQQRVVLFQFVEFRKYDFSTLMFRHLFVSCFSEGNGIFTMHHFSFFNDSPWNGMQCIEFKWVQATHLIYVDNENAHFPNRQSLLNNRPSIWRGRKPFIVLFFLIRSLKSN